MTQNKIKIYPFEELESILEQERRNGYRIVLCHGVFDLIHTGHIFHLKAAKQQGDKLVVSLTPDRYVNKGPNRPYFHETMRLQNISEIECVDYVTLNKWPTAVETIFKLKPNSYVKGMDYLDNKDDLTKNIDKEKAAIEEIKGNVIITNEFTSSSSYLLNKYFPSCSEEAIQYLKEFKNRYALTDIFDFLDRLSNLKILLLGEAIMDCYNYCLPLGKATKSAIVSTKFLGKEFFLGGSLAIANHISNFCRQVTLVTHIGDEPDINQFVASNLNKNIHLVRVPVQDRPTIVKTRFIDRENLSKLFEIQFIDDQPIQKMAEEKLSKDIEVLAPQHDLIVVSDYGHGFFTEHIIGQLVESKSFLSVNAQANSANLGFNLITKYHRANYVCMDEPELKLAASHKYLDIETMIKKLRNKCKFENIMISRGASGTVFLGSENETEITPVFSSDIVDRLGAGDALFSLTASLMHIQCPPKMLGFLANCAGAMAIKTLCNREQLSPVPLKKFIKSLLA